MAPSGADVHYVEVSFAGTTVWGGASLIPTDRHDRAARAASWNGCPRPKRAEMTSCHRRQRIYDWAYGGHSLGQCPDPAAIPRTLLHGPLGGRRVIFLRATAGASAMPSELNYRGHLGH